MTTKTVAKLVTNLSKEVRALRSLVISVIKENKEGTYRSAFIRSVIKATALKPTERFTNAKDFLKKLKQI